jgi:hypothetical protein
MQTKGHTMTDTSHPGTTPDNTETASDLHSATGQPGRSGDWAASLAKLLRVAFRTVDTDRECAKAAIARASSLLRVQVERSSFDSIHNRARLRQDIGVRRQVEEALERHSLADITDHASAKLNASRLLLRLIAIGITRRKQAEGALGDVREQLQIRATLAITVDGEGLHSLYVECCDQRPDDEFVNFAKTYP